MAIYAPIATPEETDVKPANILRRSLTLKALVVMTGAFAVFGLVAAPTDPIKNSDCLECHADKDLTKKGADGKEHSLFVDEKLFLTSVHRTNSCASCHADLTRKHPDDNVAAKPVDCSA